MIASNNKGSLPKNRSPALIQSGIIPSGFDPGNGWTKTILDLEEVKQPSYVLPVTPTQLHDIPQSDMGCAFQYVGGDRADLIGQSWLTGITAYQINPRSCLRVVDANDGKVQYGLQLLIGSIGIAEYRREWNVAVAASIHDTLVYAPGLTRALNGRHEVIWSESDRSSTVQVEVLKVFPEGYGAKARISNPSGNTLLLDIGNGTVIGSVFSPKSELIDSKTFADIGVETLIDRIAGSFEARKYLGEEGDRQVIRDAIEKQSFEYGYTGWNFKTLYIECLKGWINESLGRVMRFAKPYIPTASARYAIGGGSQLPFIPEVLNAYQIEGRPYPIQVNEEGAFANARGLRRLAGIILDRRLES